MRPRSASFHVCYIASLRAESRAMVLETVACGTVWMKALVYEGSFRLGSLTRIALLLFMRGTEAEDQQRTHVQRAGPFVAENIERHGWWRPK
jgi:hypothetical protein